MQEAFFIIAREFQHGISPELRLALWIIEHQEDDGRGEHPTADSDADGVRLTEKFFDDIHLDIVPTLVDSFTDVTCNPGRSPTCCTGLFGPHR